MRFLRPVQDPFSIHIARDLTFPLHLHPQLELFLVLSGKSLVTVRGQSKILEPGALALMFPNQVTPTPP